MAISVAHFIMSLESVKQEQRIIMQKRADKRAQELEQIRIVIHRKKDSDILEYIFTFQVFLVGALVASLWYA